MVGLVSPTIVTHSGKYFNFLEPSPDTVDINDIAHALSHLCRFTGHTAQFYSVAQHSVLVSEILPPNLQLAGLLHDATEAYVGDVSRPLKMMLPRYKEIEERVWLAIAAKFDLPADLPKQIKDANNIMLLTEKRDLMAHSSHGQFWEWAKDITPLPTTIQRWPSWVAKKVFLERFHAL